MSDYFCRISGNNAVPLGKAFCHDRTGPDYRVRPQCHPRQDNAVHPYPAFFSYIYITRLGMRVEVVQIMVCRDYSYILCYVGASSDIYFPESLKISSRHLEIVDIVYMKGNVAWVYNPLVPIYGPPCFRVCTEQFLMYQSFCGPFPFL